MIGDDRGGFMEVMMDYDDDDRGRVEVNANIMDFDNFIGGCNTFFI